MFVFEAKTGNCLPGSFKRTSSCDQNSVAYWPPNLPSKYFCLLDPHKTDFCLCLSRTVFENLTCLSLTSAHGRFCLWNARDKSSSFKDQSLPCALSLSDGLAHQDTRKFPDGPLAKEDFITVFIIDVAIHETCCFNGPKPEE